MLGNLYQSQACEIFKLPHNTLPNLPPKRVMRQLRKGKKQYFHLNCSLLFYYSLFNHSMTYYILKNINNRPKRGLSKEAKNIRPWGCKKTTNLVVLTHYSEVVKNTTQLVALLILYVVGRSNIFNLINKTPV